MAVSTRAQLRVLVAGAVIIFFSLFYFRSSLHVDEHIDSLTTLYDAKENVEFEISDSPVSSPVPAVLSLPEAYTSRPKQDEFCSALFSPAYLDNLSRNRTSFCDPNGSTSTLECFSTRIVEGRLDTLCIASNVAFHRRKRKFYMNCAHDPENPFYKVFPEYMMWTGLQYIFKEHIGLKDPERLQRSREKRSSEAKKFGVVAR
ncbi:hypothetical protein KCU89_g13080, partial [Aureobasidium melanogenum]